LWAGPLEAGGGAGGGVVGGADVGGLAEAVRDDGVVDVGLGDDLGVEQLGRDVLVGGAVHGDARDGLDVLALQQIDGQFGGGIGERPVGLVDGVGLVAVDDVLDGVEAGVLATDGDLDARALELGASMNGRSNDS
jgi:hypothetical protein